MEKHRDSTRATYHRIWKFFVKLDDKPCSWEDRLVFFTGYMVENKLKSSTVKSYIAAIRSVLLEIGEELSKENYLLKSLTRACKLKNDVIIHRLPISTTVLRMILDQIEKMFAEQPYLRLLYSAMISAAYYGLLRIGEVAQGPHAVLAKNVHIGENKPKLLFILESSKTHNRGDKPQMVKITKSPIDKERRNSKPSRHCPFSYLESYLAIRPDSLHDNEQFFVFSDNMPAQCSHIREVFFEAIKNAKLNPHAYSFHCLRTGRASRLLELGLSVETIKKIGRWHSNAVFTYLRS